MVYRIERSQVLPDPDSLQQIRKATKLSESVISHLSPYESAEMWNLHTEGKNAYVLSNCAATGCAADPGSNPMYAIQKTTTCATNPQRGIDVVVAASVYPNVDPAYVTDLVVGPQKIYFTHYVKVGNAVGGDIRQAPR